MSDKSDNLGHDDGEDKDQSDREDRLNSEDGSPESRREERFKRKKTKAAKKPAEMTIQQKREQAVHQFKSKLNQNKPYYSSFLKKFEGIAEAESVEEATNQEPSVKGDEEVGENQDRGSSKLNKSIS